MSYSAANIRLRDIKMSFIKPSAWRRVSRISNESTGLFETEKDVELKTERLDPLFGIDAIDAAYANGVAAGISMPTGKGDGHFFVMHPDQLSLEMLQMVQDGTTVILQRKVSSSPN